MFLDNVEQLSHHEITKPRDLARQLKQLFDLDHTGHLSTDKWTLLQLIATSRKNMDMTRFACRYWSRRIDLSRMSLDVPSDTTTILEKAFELEDWNLASRVVGRVDLAVPGAATIAIIQAMVVDDEESDQGRWDLIVRAVKAGVDVHWCPPKGAIRGADFEDYIWGDNEPETWSLLSWAIHRKWAPLIEIMVQKWLIRGDLRVLGAQYLHRCLDPEVLFRDFDKDYAKEDKISKGTDFRICSKIIQLLLAAGADHLTPDWHGDLPITILATGLETRMDCLDEYACWLKPLSQGVPMSFHSQARTLIEKAASDFRRSEISNFPFTPDKSVYNGFHSLMTFPNTPLYHRPAVREEDDSNSGDKLRLGLELV